MTDTQLYLVIGAPLLFNAIIYGVLMWAVSAKLDSFKEIMNTRFDAVITRLADLDERLRRVENKVH